MRPCSSPSLPSLWYCIFCLFYYFFNHFQAENILDYIFLQCLMEQPLSSSKVSVIKVVLKYIIVSSWMYGRINTFASAYLFLIYATQTFTQAPGQMELWFPLGSCTLVALFGIYKDVWQIFWSIQTVCFFFLPNKGWGPRLFPTAYSKYLFHNTSRS